MPFSQIEAYVLLVLEGRSDFLVDRLQGLAMSTLIQKTSLLLSPNPLAVEPRQLTQGAVKATKTSFPEEVRDSKFLWSTTRAAGGAGGLILDLTPDFSVTLIGERQTFSTLIDDMWQRTQLTISPRIPNPFHPRNQRGSRHPCHRTISKLAHHFPVSSRSNLGSC
jgi:hypothetical protein